MIYLDNAATSSPKPKSVIDAVNKSLSLLSANPGRSGHLDSQRVADAVYDCRHQIADFFNFSYPERVVFTQNCTHSINTVLKGIDLSGGVVTSDIEHNSVSRPLYKLSKTGINVQEAKISVNNKQKTIDNFDRLIKKGTSLVICTHVSNVFGIIIPIKEIGEICSERNVTFAVDAAQSAGVLDIDMKKNNINFLCCPGHKGLFGPMGTGILLCNGEIENTLTEGGTGNNSVIQDQPDELPERFESGTINVPGIMGLRAGILFVKNNQKKIFNHELQLSRMLHSGLEKIKNVKLYTPAPDNINYGPVISFNISGLDSGYVGTILNKNNIAVRTGLHCSPNAHRTFGTLETGTIRVSPSYFNNREEINKLLKIIKKVAKL